MAKGRESAPKRGKKKAKKKIIAATMAGALLVGGIGAVVYGKVTSSAEMPQEIKTAQSTTAEMGSISNTIVGTGNLELEEAQALTVPSGIEIEEVMVDSGDYVAAGETLATVDAASVLKAVEKTQGEIGELDGQIRACQEDDEADCIESAVDGRVKIIYAAADAEVTDVMLENGALLVLSLDGKMAVEFPAADEAAVDDSVIVRLSSGTQVDGTVAAVSGDTCTVTVTDNGTVYGDAVSVYDGSGTELGSGNLSVHQPLEITGTVGTVQSVDVSENESVTEGTALLTLEGTASQTEYEELLAEREARSQTLKKLLLLTKEPIITADMGGTVQSVNVSASTSSSSSDTGSASASGGTSSSEGGSSAKASQMSYTAKAGSTAMISLSFTDGGEGMDSYGNAKEEDRNQTDAATQDEAENHSDTATQGEAGNHSETAVQRTAANNELDVSVQEDGSTAQENQYLVMNLVNSGQCTADTLVIPAPAAGNTPVTEVTASDGSYTGMAVWNPSDAVFAENCDYRALVLLYAGDGFVFDGNSIQSVESGAVSGVNVQQDGKTLEFQITFPQTGSGGGSGSGEEGGGTGNNQGNTDSDGEHTGDNNGSGSGAQGNAGEGSNSTSGNGNGGENTTDGLDSGSGESSDKAGGDGSGSGTGSSSQSGAGSSGQGETGTSGQSGTGSSGQSGSGSSGQSGSAAQSGSASAGTQSATTAADTDGTDKSSSEISASAYSTDVTAFTISPDENMLLSVSVDELDINSVELGQTAEVSFDAIEDEAFEGEVSSIGSTASVNGGVAKYTVALKVSKDERMRQGMNASATITIESKENVVTLPLNALQEQGSRVFVYTEQSGDGTLSGEKEVITGLSDGSTVEITEGLSEGDVVYYQKTGNTQSSTGFDKSGFSGFGGETGGQMGEGGTGPERSGEGGSGGGFSGGQGSSGGQGGSGGTPPNM